MSPFTTYFSYEEFFGRAYDELRLIQDLSKYDGHTILHFILNLNTRLSVWDVAIPTNSNEYLLFIRSLFRNVLGDQLIFELKQEPSLGFPRRAFFHTRQLLYLVKLALRHCPLGSGKVFGSNPLDAGLIFLRINDQLHLKDRTGSASQNIEIRDYSILSEFISINEFTGSDPGDVALRAYQMLFMLPPEVTNKPFYLDMGEIFRREAGLDLDVYFALCFTLFVSSHPEFYKKNDYALTFTPNTWAKSNLTVATIEAFWKQVSISADQVRNMQADDHGSNDVTLFRKWPLLEHQGFALDLILVSSWRNSGSGLSGQSLKALKKHSKRCRS